MEKYQQYVNSGFEWIGDIPVQWNNLRLRFVCEFRNGYTPSKANPEFWEDGTIPWYRMEDIRDSGRKLEEAKQYVTKDAIKGGGLFEAGSFILATTATIGEHAVLIVDSLANQRFTNLKIRKSLSNRLLRDYFFYYLFVIDDYCKATTKTSTFPAVSMELLKNCHVVFPLVQEQQAIVDYLDKKCSEIDNVISAQQKRIALLQELKQSVITHAVTKGLNPNVEMKDSGVEWIGKIPASWDVVHLKRILRERMQYGANEPAESDDTTYPRYIRITDITANGELRPETFKSLEPSKAKDYLLDKGDVLFARSGATVGKTFLFNADIKACYAGYLIKASCDKRRMLPEYLYYYTQSGAYECWKNSVFIQSTIQNIGADKYQMMYIPVPSKDEQKQIVEYTMRKSQIFDAAISKAQHQVELLQEYKQSLITDHLEKIQFVGHDRRITKTIIINVEIWNRIAT